MGGTSSGGRQTVMVEISREKEAYRCRCGREFTRYYDGNYREVRDLSFGPWDRWLLFFQVRVDCPCCGVVTEALEWLEPSQRFTRRFGDYVGILCTLGSVRDVAQHLGLDWKTVKRLDKQKLERDLNPVNLDNLRILAVDELAIKKGHRYLTVVVDFETVRVVWAGRDRKEETLNQFYEQLGPERCAAVEAVA